jgi:hypothetical protein
VLDRFIPVSPNSNAKGRWRTALVAVVALAVGAGLAVAFVPRTTTPLLPAMSSSVIVVRPTPNVVVAVRDLARLESAAMHVERVVDLKDRQSHLFGLVGADDAILLVAAGEVVAGVDLAALAEEDVVVDPAKRTVKIRLPEPTVFSARLDNSRTYVHSRTTDLLAKRNEQLETEARRAAERELEAAALEARLLERAATNAKRTVENLVRGLGFERVDVEVRPAG